MEIKIVNKSNHPLPHYGTEAAAGVDGAQGGGGAAEGRGGGPGCRHHSGGEPKGVGGLEPSMSILLSSV